ncbi:hypothetical protein HYT84_01010, partial [Candidatus Micrarchaeota archaeon]|nr:hypothetical protein [Candidatus Micrarchaeota archaeon]
MELRLSLSEAEKADLKSRKWYNQRFDGCPFIFAYICAAHARRETRKEDGECSMLAFFFDGKTDYYIDMNDNERITKHFLEMSKINQNFTKGFMARWTADERTFEEMCRKVDSADLTRLSDSELVRVISEFGEKYIKRVTSSSVIDGFALGSDQIVADKIHAHLLSNGKDGDYNSLFSALTAPAHLSFTNEAEFELLKIALEVSKNPELKSLFLENDEEEIVTKLKEHRTLYDKLLNHQKNFYWLHNNYVDGHILPVEFFVSEIAKTLREK